MTYSIKIRSALSWILKHPVWAGVSGVATVLALALAFVQFGASEAQPLQRRTVEGDCSNTGDNVEIDCVVNPPLPKSIGDVDIAWAGWTTYWFDGAPEDLPDPPSYPNSEAATHCDEWAEWLAQDERVYTMQPQLWLTMLSGMSDQVVVKKVDATVMSKKPIERDFTIIQCQYGADGISGFLVTVDVGTGMTRLFDLSDETLEGDPMPPAALVLNGADYDAALIRVDSTTGYLYSGQVTVTALINGVERKIRFGNSGEPFRWVGGDPELYPKMDGDARYDWNPNTEEWVRDLDPFDVSR